MPKSRIEFNIGIQNLGPLPIAQHVSWDAVVGLLSEPAGKSKMDEMFDEFKSSIKPVEYGDLPVTGGFYITRGTRELSEQDVRDLGEGRLVVYLFTFIKYTDTGGEHETEICKTLQPPGNADIWHICVGHNQTK
jgi:hypothetical protein